MITQIKPPDGFQEKSSKLKRLYRKTLLQKWGNLKSLVRRKTKHGLGHNTILENVQSPSIVWRQMCNSPDGPCVCFSTDQYWTAHFWNKPLKSKKNGKHNEWVLREINNVKSSEPLVLLHDRHCLKPASSERNPECSHWLVKSQSAATYEVSNDKISKTYSNRNFSFPRVWKSFCLGTAITTGRKMRCCLCQLP